MTDFTIPADVLRQVRRLELRTRRLVDSRFAGDYRSLFKGQGMEFAEVREYQPGDEVRSIDWNVSARMGKPFVKRYVEERELTVMLVLDVSGSAAFGTEARFKNDVAQELATVLALAATRNNDRVGLLCFTDRVEHAVAPRKGRRHALRLVRDLLTLNPVGVRTDFSVALERLGRLLPHRSIVFVCSDFVGAELERPMARLAQRHDVIAVTIEDAAEQELPDIGVARLVDPETREQVEVDTSDPAVRAWFAEQVSREVTARQKLFGRLGIDEIMVRTDTGYVEPLLQFFRARARRAHGAVRASVRPVVKTVAGAVASALLVAGAVWGALVPGAHSLSAQSRSAHALSSRSLLAQSPLAQLPLAQLPSVPSPTPQPPPGGARPLDGVQAGIIVSPDTVTVGDPFTLVVRLRVPNDARVEWPALTDSTATVALRAPIERSARSAEPGWREELAEFPLAAWDTGSVPLGIAPAIVVSGLDSLPIVLGAGTIYVASVLSADTLEHVPRPAKAAFPREVPWWEAWWLAALIAAAVLLIAWLAWRRRRRKPVGSVSAPRLTAYERAQQSFVRLERLALADAGESGRSVALTMDVLRSYLAARSPAATLAQTSAELLAAVGDDDRIPLTQLIELLVFTDAVKFARQRVSPADAKRVLVEARALVDAVEEEERARHAALAAAAAASREDDTGSGTSGMSGASGATPTSRVRRLVGMGSAANARPAQDTNREDA